MKFPINGASLILAILLYRLSSVSISYAKLNVVTDSRHIVYLYERLKNENPVTAPDPAISNPRTREKICEDITGSGFFYWDFLKPVKMQLIFGKLNQPRYASIFRQIYTQISSENQVQRLVNPYTYDNPYRRYQLNAINSSDFNTSTRTVTTREDLFICLMMNSRNRLVPYYVSKEYNIYEGEGEVNVPGRFLFRSPQLNAPANHFQILLAEEPAIGIKRTNFNVELYYLGIRRYRQPVVMRHDDPVCQLTSQDVSKNQSYRICAEIYGSDYFKNEVKYPMPWFHHECMLREVTFITTEAKREAGTNTYSEYMIPCETRIKGSSRRITYYISRAYRRHQVFTYHYVKVGGRMKLVLENRNTNVHAVDELLGFDDVE